MRKILCEKRKRIDHYIREEWVDNVKAIACVLVVSGHFFQSMVRAGILPENVVYQWFNQTIYCFHVPLFFICSGYLYQQYSCVVDIKSWMENILNKLLVLGVPYFIFSIITWLLKNIFAGEVNSAIGNIVETLFINPTAPYWYLYCLFFIFFVTLTFNKRVAMICVIIISICLKIMSILGVGGYCPYAISSVLANEVWFVFGMVLSVINYPKIMDQYHNGIKSIGLITGVMFLILSLLIIEIDYRFELILFFLGMLACISIIILSSTITLNKKQCYVFEFLSKYTFPIFLLHTIFAALFRIVLLKIGVRNAVAHVILGMIISFVGPICMAIVMKKILKIDFLLYPGKYIKS